MLDRKEEGKPLHGSQPPNLGGHLKFLSYFFDRSKNYLQLLKCEQLSISVKNWITWISLETKQFKMGVHSKYPKSCILKKLDSLLY